MVPHLEAVAERHALIELPIMAHVPKLRAI